jgi:hypothetical protein
MQLLVRNRKLARLSFRKKCLAATMPELLRTFLSVVFDQALQTFSSGKMVLAPPSSLVVRKLDTKSFPGKIQGSFFFSKASILESKSLTLR